MHIKLGNIIQYYCEYVRMVIVLLLYLCLNNYPKVLCNVMGKLQIINILVDGVLGRLGTQENINSNGCLQKILQ